MNIPQEDIGENIGFATKVAILIGLIGMIIILCLFEIPRIEQMYIPVMPTKTPSFSDNTSGTPSFIVAAHDSSVWSKSQANYICDGNNDQIEINSAFDALPQGGEVILSEGTFNCDGPIFLKTSSTLRGQGDTTTFLKLTKAGIVWVDKEFVILEKFHISDSSRNSDIAKYGVITIRAGNCIVRDVTGTCDATMLGVFFVVSQDHSGYNKIIENIEFNNCKAIDCGGFGFINSAWTSKYKLIRNMRYIDCQAINCGRYERPSFNPWVTGFDFAELNHVENLEVTGCIAEGCWESGFHFEYEPDVTNAILTDCISRNNGQKPYPNRHTQEFLSGYYVGRGEVTFVNCLAEGNSFAGFYADDGSNVKMYGCTDIDTAIGEQDFSIYKPASYYIIHSSMPVVMNNCTSTNSNGRGLYIGNAIARVQNFVMTDAAGVDGTAIQLQNVKSGSIFDVHASGNRASTVISMNEVQDARFTGKIVSDVTRPIMIDGSGTHNLIIHDVEIISNTLNSKSNGITISEKVSSGAIQVVNCNTVSPNNFLQFIFEMIFHHMEMTSNYAK